MDRKFTNMDSELELWYAFAGPVVQIPPANSLVYYFIQGHLEHCCIEDLNMVALGFDVNPRSHILCKVDSVNYLADPVTDQVLTKFRLTPLENHQQIEPDDSLYHNPTRPPDQIKRFPEPVVKRILEYNNNLLLPKNIQFSMKYDLHRNHWLCECIPIQAEPYIGPMWKDKLREKKVMEGDIILFMEYVYGDERFGVLRGKRKTYDSCYCLDLSTVVSAIMSAHFYKPFDVYYYPRIDTPEFVVNAARVKAAMQIPWHVRMRFTIQYEDEHTSLAQTCRGTISSVEDVDHVKWPNSPWRMLEVIMDPPYLNLNEMRVNPWMLKLEDTGESSSSSSHDVEPDLSVNVTSYQAFLQDAINVNRPD